MKSMMPRTKLLRDFINQAKSSVAYQAEHKMRFHREGRRVLRAIAEELGLQSGTYDIRSNLGGIAVSGEVILHGESIYIHFSQGVTVNRFYYRSCKGRKDYTGGLNNWMDWDELYDLPAVCKAFKLVSEKGYL